jgi:hypothetical protein
MEKVIYPELSHELKVRPKLGYTDIKQVVGYLRNSSHKLAVMIYFARNEVKYRRIINAG